MLLGRRSLPNNDVSLYIMTTFCAAISEYANSSCSVVNPPPICSLAGYLTFKEKLFKAKINPFSSQTQREHILFTYDFLETNLKNGNVNYTGSWTSAMLCTLPDKKTIYNIGYKPNPAISFLSGRLVKISPDFEKLIQYVPPVVQMFISADLFIVLLFIAIIIAVVIYSTGYDNVKNELSKYII